MKGMEDRGAWNFAAFSNRRTQPIATREILPTMCFGIRLPTYAVEAGPDQGTSVRGDFESRPNARARNPSSSLQTIPYRLMRIRSNSCMLGAAC